MSHLTVARECLTEAEIFHCLNSFSNNKSPGTDGLSSECQWYKFFWEDIKLYLSNNFHYLQTFICKMYSQSNQASSVKHDSCRPNWFLKNRYIGENLIKPIWR